MDSGLLLDGLFNKWMHGERTIGPWRIVISLVSLIDSAEVTKELMAKRKAHGEKVAE